MKLLCQLAVLALVAQALAQGFTGTWRDNDGRLIFICEDDGDLHGSYNEVGLIQADASGDDADGRLYQAIHPRDGCSVRRFQWKRDGEEFSGEWECEDISIEGNWNARRISTARPPSNECVRIARSGTLSGTWAYSSTYTQDICIDDDDFLSSYSYTGGEGTSFGEVFEGGRVLIGNWDEMGPVEGWDLYALLDNGQMLNYYWDSSVDDEDVAEFDTISEDLHGAEFAARTAVTAGKASCRRNANLMDSPYSPFPSGPAPPPPSPGAASNGSPASPRGRTFTIPRTFPTAPHFFSTVVPYQRSLPTVIFNSPQAPGAYRSSTPTPVSESFTTTAPAPFFASDKSQGGFIVYRSPKTLTPPPVYFPESYARILTYTNSVDSPDVFDPNNYQVVSSSFQFPSPPPPPPPVPSN
eukprot:TRINITY_DN3835_c1_g1_i1.p2 TRINITY_DN3835_c1_g1~~TRINITY_DN3835_c1_g1_i1.p2  ORF type:complete len:411 (+),score=136.35 TRINITY_DN3835_c1_g1_i1:32-1264(+)